MTISYLALGDSYTIGEQVLLHENFPCQVVQMLRKENSDHFWLAPEILAKTGWTTDELLAAISSHQFLPEYDFVTLLIGVNNQYRGRDAASFRPEFRELLQKALGFAGGRPSHVIVLSIPDWGVTPFAADRNKEMIQNEIDLFNQVCEEESVAENVHFINITDAQRVDGGQADFLAADGLHPSAREYAKWASQVRDIILEHVDD